MEIKGVGAIIKSRSDKNELLYLFIQRADSLEWGLVGGGIDAGETALQACVREIHEEVGLVCTEYELESLGLAKSPPNPYKEADSEEGYSANYVLNLEYVPTLMVEPREIADYKWIRANELRMFMDENKIYPSSMYTIYAYYNKYGSFNF